MSGLSGNSVEEPSGKPILIKSLCFRFLCQLKMLECLFRMSCATFSIILFGSGYAGFQMDYPFCRMRNSQYPGVFRRKDFSCLTGGLAFMGDSCGAIREYPIAPYAGLRQSCIAICRPKASPGGGIVGWRCSDSGNPAS